MPGALSILGEQFLYKNNRGVLVPMNKSSKTLLALGVSMALGTALPSASASVFSVDVTGTQSWDEQGDLDNTIMVIDVAAELGLASGSSVTIIGVGWDVSLATNGLSWLSEATVFINGEVTLAPGTEDNPGTGNYSSGGIINLFDNGIPDIVLSDGLLTLEFFESYDDVADSVDAIWTAGTLSFETAMAPVPLPAALPLLLVSLGGLAMGGRRRRVS